MVVRDTRFEQLQLCHDVQLRIVPAIDDDDFAVRIREQFAQRQGHGLVQRTGQPAAFDRAKIKVCPRLRPVRHRQFCPVIHNHVPRINGHPVIALFIPQLQFSSDFS
jgi:hypothetical protein